MATSGTTRSPTPRSTPINIIEEITKPITLTFRLFGNIFSGVLMMAVIATLIPLYLSWIGLAVWKPFDSSSSAPSRPSSSPC